MLRLTPAGRAPAAEVRSVPSRTVTGPWKLLPELVRISVPAPRLVKPPHQDVKPILPKEHFAVKADGGHAPVACRAQQGVVFCQPGIVMRRIGGNRSLQFRQIKPGPRRSLRQMIAAVPTCDGSIPQQARHFVGKGQPVAAFGRSNAQAAKACGKGLVVRDG